MLLRALARARAYAGAGAGGVHTLAAGAGRAAGSGACRSEGGGAGGRRLLGCKDTLLSCCCWLLRLLLVVLLHGLKRRCARAFWPRCGWHCRRHGRCRSGGCCTRRSPATSVRRLLWRDAVRAGARAHARCWAACRGSSAKHKRSSSALLVWRHRRGRGACCADCRSSRRAAL